MQRVPVADAAVPWSASAPGYAPPDYTHARILEAPPYADPKDPRLVDWSQKRFSLEYQRRNMSQLRFDKETGRVRKKTEKKLGDEFFLKKKINLACLFSHLIQLVELV